MTDNITIRLQPGEFVTRGIFYFLDFAWRHVWRRKGSLNIFLEVGCIPVEILLPINYNILQIFKINWEYDKNLN